MKRLTALVFACIVGLSSVAFVSCSGEDDNIGGTCSSSSCIPDTEPDISIDVYTSTEYLTTISPRTEACLSLEVGIEYIFGCDMLYTPKSCNCSAFVPPSDYATTFDYDTDYLLITDSKKSVDKVHYYYISALAPTESTILTATLLIAPLEINVSISGTSVDTTDDNSEIVTNDEETTIEQEIEQSSLL